MIDILSDKTLKKSYKEHDLAVVILFGSFAKNLNRLDSDVDIAILFGNVSRPFDYSTKEVKNNSHLIYDVLTTKMRSHSIDLAILNYADPLLWYEVSQSGKLIYEKEEGQFRKFCIRALQRHNDARSFYEAEKRYLERLVGSD